MKEAAAKKAKAKVADQLKSVRDDNDKKDASIKQLRAELARAQERKAAEVSKPVEKQEAKAAGASKPVSKTGRDAAETLVRRAPSQITQQPILILGITHV